MLSRGMFFPRCMWDLALHSPFTAAMAAHLIPVCCFEKAPISPCSSVIEVDQAEATSDNHWDMFSTHCILQPLSVPIYKQEIRKLVLKKKKG